MEFSNNLQNNDFAPNAWGRIKGFTILLDVNLFGGLI